MSMRGWWSARVVHPIDLPEIMRAFGTVLFAIAAFTGLVLVNGAKNDEKGRAESLSAQVSANQDVSDCRSRLSTAVTDASTSYQFAIGQDQLAQDRLVESLAGQEVQEISGALAELHAAGEQITATGVRLDAARDARVEYEKHPDQQCPVVNPSAGTQTPQAGTTSTSTPTSTTGKPRRATTTTRRTTTTASTVRPRPTTTSTADDEPPPCDLIPGSGITLPPMVPCL